MDWDCFDFAVFLHDVMAPMYPFDFPAVFLEQIQQVFVFHVPPPYNHIITRATRIIKRDFEVFPKKKIFLYHPES